MERRKAAWLTPATSRSCVTASITTGCAPTASTSSVIRGSSRVSTHGARSNIEGSAASMPDVSLPHIGWPPTRSIPSAAAHSTTLAFVLAMSVMGLPPALSASCANISRMALIGAPTMTISAISTTLRSVLAVDTIPRSSALRSTMGFRSLPTRTISGLAFLRASAKDEPIRPRPTTATVATYASCFCMAPSSRRTSAIRWSKAAKSSD